MIRSYLLILLLLILSSGVSANEQGDLLQTDMNETKLLDVNDMNTKELPAKLSMKENVEMLWRFLFEKANRVPQQDLPEQPVDYSALNTENGGVKSAWLGHSSLLISVDGRLILTDPVFEKKVTVVGPKRFNKSYPASLGELPVVDVVIISHDHYDHLNKYSIRKLKRRARHFVVPRGVGELLTKWGIEEHKVTELNWWDEFTALPGLTVAATPAQHFSGRGLTDRNKRLWASWVIKTENHSLFFSGDGGYFSGFKTIGDKYGPFDVTFMECGAYDEMWEGVHMLPEQSIQASIDLKGTVFHPIHMATFNLAFHAWYEPLERMVKAAAQKGVAITTPVRGAVIDYEQELVTNYWWRPLMEGEHVDKELAANFKLAPQPQEK